MAKTEKPELIFQVKNPKHFMQVYKWHDHKFRINCEHTNGDSLGFNHKCCVAIMTSEGEWSNLEDNRSLDFEWHNYYFMSESEPIMAVNESAVEHFLDYIMKVF